MNLTQLESFLRVAENGSFSRAALVLGVAQPSLSRHVRSLEIELRQSLLVRHGRGVRVTEAGQLLLEHCRSMLHLVDAVRDDLSANRNEAIGQVSLAMPPTLARLYTLPLIQTFRSEMPKARLSLTEGFSAHITEWLVSGRIDFGLIHDPEPLPTLSIRPLRRARLCLVSPAGQAPPGPVSWPQLSRLPLVMPGREHIVRKMMESAAAMAGARLRVEWEVSSVPVIIDLVAAGIGHAALDEQAALLSKEPRRLVVTPFGDPSLETTLCLVAPAQQRPTVLRRLTAELLGHLATNG